VFSESRIERELPLNWLVSCLNRSLLGQFLREICPFKKYSPKYNAANSGIIAGELLTAGGDQLDYEGKTSTDTAGLETIKIHTTVPSQGKKQNTFALILETCS
jgi:hypothetical protein